MKLDRNDEGSGRWPGTGKYALVLLREVENYRQGTFGELPQKLVDAFETLEELGILDMGAVNTPSEFFVMRLKDRYSKAGLRAYAEAAALDDNMEWSREVQELADRAGIDHPHCKRPD